MSSENTRQRHVLRSSSLSPYQHIYSNIQQALRETAETPNPITGEVAAESW